MGRAIPLWAVTTTLPPGPPFSLSGLFETRSYAVPVSNHPGQEGGALLTPPTQCFAFGPAGMEAHSLSRYCHLYPRQVFRMPRHTSEIWVEYPPSNLLGLPNISIRYLAAALVESKVFTTWLCLSSIKTFLEIDYKPRFIISFCDTPFSCSFLLIILRSCPVTSCICFSPFPSSHNCKSASASI